LIEKMKYDRSYSSERRLFSERAELVARSTRRAISIGILGATAYAGRLPLSCIVTRIEAQAGVARRSCAVDQQLRQARERLVLKTQTQRELSASRAQIKNPLGGLTRLAQLLERELHRPGCANNMSVHQGGDRLQR